jgi:uncharacterized protein (TIGR00725 family)
VPTAPRIADAIAVIGPASDVTDELSDLARTVGGLLAQRGIVVVTGGLGGVMAAAAHGVHNEGGVVIGLLPGTDRTAGNEFLTVAIPTGLGEARNALVVGAAEAVIVIGGSWGTLSEIALARRTDKPVVTIRGWGVSDETGRPLPLLAATSAAAAVRLATNAIAERKRDRA